MEYRLELDYRLSAGRLQPWIDGLREGTAKGLSCTDCSRVSFPPVRRCSCGSARSDWVTLPGTATIEERSDGPGISFALVRFDGADTLATVRLSEPEETTKRGRLVAVSDGPPALLLRPGN